MNNCDPPTSFFEPDEEDFTGSLHLGLSGDAREAHIDAVLGRRKPARARGLVLIVGVALLLALAALARIGWQTDVTEVSLPAIQGIAVPSVDSIRVLCIDSGLDREIAISSVSDWESLVKACWPQDTVRAGLLMGGDTGGGGVACVAPESRIHVYRQLSACPVGTRIWDR